MSTVPETQPDIFTYLNYREFLADYYRHRKSVDKRFSHRFVMEKVGATSPSWFNDIVKGRINLSGRLLLKLTQLLKLKPRETDYFETLVQYDQAAGLDEKNRSLEKIMSFKGMKMDVLGKEKFEFYAHWYYSAIRELLFFYDFDGDFSKLARKLNPPIRKEQAAKAIELLDKLGLIRKQAGGHYRPTSENIIKDSGFKSLHIANFIRTNIELAFDAFARIPKEERDISTVTVCLSPKGFEEIKAELKSLRHKLLALAERDKEPETVYQCNFQIFPTTK